MSNDLVESNYEQVILDLLARVKRLEGGSVVAQELSEISSDMGLIEGGELRIHSDWADPKEPGDGFSGVRILGSFEYPVGSGKYYAVVGVNNDALTFGLSAIDGSAIFCSGNATIDQDGISGTDLLTYFLSQNATNSGNERNGKLGLVLQDGGAIPTWELSYSSPGSVELVDNGDAEDGDFTSWTKTTETNGAWSAQGFSTYAGTYCFKFTPSGANNVGVLTSDRIAVGENNYSVQVAAKGGGGTIEKAEVKWYDHASAGSLLRTDVILNGAPLSSWALYSAELEAPVSSLSAEIVLTHSNLSGSTGLPAYFDGVSMMQITVNQKLQLTDDGLATTNGLFPRSVILFPTMIESSTSALTYYVTASQMWNMYGTIAAASAADGDEYNYSFMAEKGTYSMFYYYVKSSLGGKADIYIDGVKVVSLLEHYAASATWDQKSTTTNISITFSGRHELQVKCNGKHASSGDYSIYQTAICLYRTGA